MAIEDKKRSTLKLHLNTVPKVKETKQNIEPNVDMEQLMVRQQQLRNAKNLEERRKLINTKKIEQKKRVEENKVVVPKTDNGQSINIVNRATETVSEKKNDIIIGKESNGNNNSKENKKDFKVDRNFKRSEKELRERRNNRRDLDKNKNQESKNAENNSKSKNNLNNRFDDKIKNNKQIDDKLLESTQPVVNKQKEFFKKDRKYEEFNEKEEKEENRNRISKKEFKEKMDEKSNKYKNNYLISDDSDDDYSSNNNRSSGLKSFKRSKVKKNDNIHQKVYHDVQIPEFISVSELADRMSEKKSDVVKKLFIMGMPVTVNQTIDADTAELIVTEFGHTPIRVSDSDVEKVLNTNRECKEFISRSPVVTVMGHVDHGKTSLLDAIRETHVTAKESGGITQKIGAYQVNVHGNLITFLDTPGHEAFTAMRMRGAQATDIAILVVAADDGVMPQTIEAINHAKAAEVEIIVAVNKIDKPNANIEKVKQELTEYGLIAEDWGGSTTFVPVSAHTKEGIDELLDMILLTAEVNELKANPDRKARGIVIEAELDKGRGPVASILVQKGTLHVGDAVSAGSCYGKIRAMIDDKGNRVKTAGPSTPVEILGLNDVPNAGEIIMAADSEKEARSTAETFISEGRKKLLDDTKHKVSLDALFEQIQAGNMKELNIIIKADVQGSVEAVKSSLVRLSNEEVVVKVIHGGVGNVNESDVVLASASNAIIIAFNVKPDNQARIVAEREKVDLRLYSVIYNAIEDVEAALKGMLEPIYEEKIIGHARIMQIFKASGVGNIAGCIVEEGRITRDSVVRITRGSEKVYEGPIASLKHFKDEVKEIKAGTECGMVFEKFNDIQPEDMIEAHIMVEVPR